MAHTPKHRDINRRPQPFEIKQIKGNYWWSANCLKSNDKTAASCEDWRLKDTLQRDWHLPYTHTLTVCTENIYSWRGDSFHVADQSSELTEGSVSRLRFNCHLCSRFFMSFFDSHLHQLKCSSYRSLLMNVQPTLPSGTASPSIPRWSCSAMGWWWRGSTGVRGRWWLLQTSYASSRSTPWKSCTHSRKLILWM